jgi:glycosyltransferase involved in cell wall biosynthesis
VLSEVGGDERKYITIYNGVDMGGGRSHRTVAKPDVGLREGVPVIGTVCRLIEPDKGITVLLQAMAKLTGPPAPLACQLLIVGEGPARSQLHDLGQRLGILSRVVFTGMRRDIADLLPLLDVFVMPSLSEGFGIAIVEAMAAGRPVVASAVGGIPEIVQHEETGLLVPPGDPVALAAALRDLLTRPDRARALGACGQQRARERFSIEVAVKRHEDLYEKLMAKRA